MRGLMATAFLVWALPALAAAQDAAGLAGNWTRDRSAGTEHIMSAPGIPGSWFTGPVHLVITTSPAEVAIARTYGEAPTAEGTARYRFDGYRVDGKIGNAIIAWDGGRLVMTQKRPARGANPGREKPAPATLVTKEVYTVTGNTLTCEKSLSTISGSGAMTGLDLLTYTMVFKKDH